MPVFSLSRITNQRIAPPSVSHQTGGTRRRSNHRQSGSLAVLLTLCLGATALPPVAYADTSTSNSTTQPLIRKIGGFLPDLKFTLSGAGDRTVTQDDLAGKVVVMFFGYANCPDICPTTMAQLALVMRKLGEQAQDARILFVSVDPHRDRPDPLQAYVNMFDPNAMGLSGTTKQITDLARRYRVAFQIEKPKGDDAQRYEVTHARGIYIFDREGKARLLASDASAVDDLVTHLKALLGS